MKYDTTFLDTYKKYVSKGWYDAVISSTTLERWSENFMEDPLSGDFDPKVCAHFLLNSLVFYQDRQLEAIILSIENKIKSQLNEKGEMAAGYRLSEAQLENLWKTYRQECCIVAGASLEATGDSAHHAARLWRNITGIKTVAISTLVTEIEEHKKKHIIFVDDFIGTGRKMYAFLTENHFPKRDFYGFMNVREVVDRYRNSVDFSVAVFSASDVGVKEISKEFPALAFYYGDLYDAGYDLLSEKCVLYDVFSDHKDRIISYLSRKNRELDADNPFALNLPVSFHGGCPNNSLSLYYKSNRDWVGLLPEGHPKRI